MNADITLLLTLLPTFAFMTVLAFLSTPLAPTIFLGLVFYFFTGTAPLPFDFWLRHDLAGLFNSSALISIPLFVLAGEVAVTSGIGGRLFRLAGLLVRRNGFSLGGDTMIGFGLFATVSASGAAGIREWGRRRIRALARSGLPPAAAAAAVAAAAGLCMVIPASPALTLYAAQSHTVTNIIFTASFIPGLLAGVALYLALCLHYGKGKRCGSGRRRLGAKRIIPAKNPVKSGFFPQGEKTGRPGKFSGRGKTLLAALLPATLLPFLFTGFLLAPEAAAYASLYGLCYGAFVSGSIGIKRMADLFTRAALIAGAMLFLAAMGSLFSAAMNEAGLQDCLARMVPAACGRWGAIVAVNLALLALGCFLEPPAVIILAAPLFLPLANACGIGTTQYGVMVTLNAAMALITPPEAANLSAATLAAGLRESETARCIPPYFVVLAAVLCLTAAWPEASLFLPRWFGWKV